ncbi:unnamed protein product [Scytosiphon promiscuus]
MEKHGFVVLTETGAVRDAYIEFMELLKAFFDGNPNWKESCKGGVHFNERGIPMWHTGYERCGDVREAFRVPAATFRPSSSPLQPWPCQRLRRAWLAVLRLLQRVCHRALTLTLGRPVLGAPPPRAKSPGVTEGRGNSKRQRAETNATGPSSERCPVCCGGVRAGQARPRPDGDAEGGGGERGRSLCFDSGDGRENQEHRVKSSGVDGVDSGVGCGRGGTGTEDDEDDAGEDFSVSYALRYPNEFADPALVEEDLTVGEHVDPSLYVAEPCCGVEGLEIQDRASGRWLPVEAVCAGLGDGSSRSLAAAEGRELILFGGKALERATEARVRGAPHRVRRGDLGRRHCFIYEQKYAEFFPPPALD